MTQFEDSLPPPRRPARFAVMLHAFNLILSDPASGDHQLGGAHTWRYVDAPNKADAITHAIAMLRSNDIFVRNIHNAGDSPPRFEAEEVVELDRDDLQHGDGTGIMFYMDTDVRPQ